MKHHSVQRDYWRSLEHLANTPEVQLIAEKEFVAYDPEDMSTMSSVTRRRFMKLMGASMALAGITLSGCRRWPQAKLAPYTSNPANRTPGAPEQYATVLELVGVASPLLVTSFDGRPIKVEGNPNHPFSQTVAGKIGAADAVAQASVLELYDPDRSTAVKSRAAGTTLEADWLHFAAAFAPVLDAFNASGGQGLAILSESSSSPTTARLKTAVLKRLPRAQFYEYEPLSRAAEIQGSQMALGQSSRKMLHLDQANIVACFDADPLGTHPAHIRYASDWSSRRRAMLDDPSQANRVYVVESAFTTTGGIADVRLPVKPSRVGTLLAALGAALGVGSSPGTLTPDEQKFVDQLHADIAANTGKSVVAIGADQPAEVHALGLAINNAIGAIGATLTLHEEPTPGFAMGALPDLAKQLSSNAIDTLVILGGNIAYDAPGDINIGALIKQAKFSVHLSLYDNETSQLCNWHVPRAHYLEAWGDARAWDGTISIVQPLIEPLYDGKTPDQLLALLAGEAESASDDIVRKTFAGIFTSGDFNTQFRHALHDGLVKDSAFKTISASVKAPPAISAQPASAGFEVRFHQDRKIYDGRFAGSGWLQELPDTMTKVVWDNVATVSPKDAAQLGVSTNSNLSITIANQTIKIPAFVLPGQPLGVIGLALGYGRTSAGHIGTGVGVNVYPLRTSTAMAYAPAQVASAGDSYDLATTQDHHLFDELGIHKRQEQVGETKYSSAEIIRESTVADLKADPALFRRNQEGAISLQLYSPPMEFNTPHAWGMAIDLSSCIGCQACVIACQAENNIPIVGRDQVQRNRQMHWLRIDRYFKGAADDVSPEVVYQPVTCQHCENAPCEQVCPVGATMHDTEGLNVMVYNRCVGTRYCSNNCPYKVRRFNYLDWHNQDPRNDKYPKPWLNLPDQADLDPVTVPQVARMVYNPDVTVRMRGVMEKCTFCIQRIHETTIHKRATGEDVADGDILTACQQTCPTQAIVFGNLNDKESKVSKLHASDRAYALLDEALNTKPRNRYLAKISNPSDQPTGKGPRST
jgi:molybdopterin-containing oxidoreductase family iron-sulfur binding subunit